MGIFLSFEFGVTGVDESFTQDDESFQNLIELFSHYKTDILIRGSQEYFQSFYWPIDGGCTWYLLNPTSNIIFPIFFISLWDRPQISTLFTQYLTSPLQLFLHQRQIFSIIRIFLSRVHNLILVSSTQFTLILTRFLNKINYLNHINSSRHRTKFNISLTLTITNCLTRSRINFNNTSI